MYLAYSGTLYMKLHLLKITKCFAHYICSYIICISNDFLKAPFLIKKKISNKQFHHCKVNIFLEKVTKSINSQTNIKSSGNDNLTVKFYKHLSNELKPNVYQSYPIL